MAKGAPRLALKGQDGGTVDQRKTTPKILALKGQDGGTVDERKTSLKILGFKNNKKLENCRGGAHFQVI